MTKHYNKPNTYADTPIAISEEYTKPDTIEFMCSYCQRLLLKNKEDEYYCKKCSYFDSIQNMKTYAVSQR